MKKKQADRINAKAEKELAKLQEKARLRPSISAQAHKASQTHVNNDGRRGTWFAGVGFQCIYLRETGR